MMHGLRTNNLAPVASSMEEAYRFAETPTLAVLLVDYYGGHQHNKDMARTHHTRYMMISDNWASVQPWR